MPKYKRWTEDEIENVGSYVSNGWSINKACKEYWVPRATLQRIIKNGEPNKSGRKPYLTYYEPGELVKYVTYKSRTEHRV